MFTYINNTKEKIHFGYILSNGKLLYALYIFRVFDDGFN
jgi:hypothetical protein